MELEDKIKKYCLTCKNKKINSSGVLICSVTSETPDFDVNCGWYEKIADTVTMKGFLFSSIILSFLILEFCLLVYSCLFTSFFLGFITEDYLNIHPIILPLIFNILLFYSFLRFGILLFKLRSNSLGNLLKSRKHIKTVSIHLIFILLTVSMVLSFVFGGRMFGAG